MIHEYTRHCFRAADGKAFVEHCTINGEDLAIAYGKQRGDRLDFLEVVNRWNRAGVGNPDYFYTYVAGESRA